jgi:hypothetical protein
MSPPHKQRCKIIMLSTYQPYPFQSLAAGAWQGLVAALAVQQGSVATLLHPRCDRASTPWRIGRAPERERVLQPAGTCTQQQVSTEGAAAAVWTARCCWQVAKWEELRWDSGRIYGGTPREELWRAGGRIHDGQAWICGEPTGKSELLCCDFGFVRCLPKTKPKKPKPNTSVFNFLAN